MLPTFHPVSSRRRWSALALIVTAQFMVILDVAIVNVALPSIKTDLGFSDTGLQWVITAHAILFGGTLRSSASARCRDWEARCSLRLRSRS